MKKVFLFATVALLTTSAAFASKEDKKCGSHSCCKSKKEATAKKEVKAEKEVKKKA